MKVPTVVIGTADALNRRERLGAEIVGANRFLQRCQAAVGKRVDDHARRKHDRARRSSPSRNTEKLNANKSPMMSFRLSAMSPSQPMPMRVGAPISADTPSKLLAASVLQPRSTRRITKCTDTPSVTMWRSAIAIERNQKALRRNTSFNVNCGSKERCAGERTAGVRWRRQLADRVLRLARSY